MEFFISIYKYILSPSAHGERLDDANHGRKKGMDKVLEQKTRGRMMKGLGIGDIGPVALTMGYAIMIVAVVALVLATMSGASTNGNFTAIIGLGLAAITSFATWFNILITIVICVIILALILTFGGSGGGRKRRRG